MSGKVLPSPSAPIPSLPATSREFLSDEERAVVEAEQVRAFFKETNDQNVAGAVVLSLLVYVVSDGIPSWTWAPALYGLYGVTLVRAWLIRQYHRTPDIRSAAVWGRGQALSGGLSGICWGIATTAMLAHVSVEYQLVILTVITVVAASSASEGFSYPPPSQAFILASMIPPTIWLVTVGDRMHLSLALMLVVFLPMTLLQGRKRNRVFVEAQQLRFRNEALARELTVQRDAAEQAYLAKARFLAAASHDLRQPMQALSIFHELLHREMPASGPGSELLSNARKAADAMNTLLDSLLDVSKLDASVVEPDCSAFAVQTLLDQMKTEFGAIAEHKEIRLRIAPCSAIIVSDRVLLGQVLRNLVSNAIRYTSSGRILVGCRRQKGRLAIEVFDTGIGIARDQHAAIFAEFYQVGNKARDRQQGIGLGLAIVDRIVRLLEHPLTLCSEPGRGSCFAVIVPLASPGARPAVPSIEPADAHEAGSLAGRRILVIEDEEAIRAGMCALLSGWGCEVTSAVSVADALHQVLDGTAAIDAVISDMGLPGPDNGIDAIAALRRLYGGNLPALLITGDTSPAALQAAREASLVMLHKPIKPARMRAALREAVAATPR